MSFVILKGNYKFMGTVKSYPYTALKMGLFTFFGFVTEKRFGHCEEK